MGIWMGSRGHGTGAGSTSGARRSREEIRHCSAQTRCSDGDRLSPTSIREPCGYDTGFHRDRGLPYGLHVGTVRGWSADPARDNRRALCMASNYLCGDRGVLYFGRRLSSRRNQRRPDLLTLPGAGDFTILLLFSFFVVFGLVPAAFPHLTVRAMSYQDTASVHRAIYIGPVIMAIFTLGFIGIGPVARVFYPELAVGDLAVPRMIVELLPGWVAGALFAAPMAAIMSTVDSMILVVSSTIVRDLYMNYFNPRLPDHSASRLGSWTSLILGVIVLLISLRPPQLLEYLILFAIGGLASTLFIPLVAGLYWKRANATAAVLGMVGGMGGYVFFRVFVPDLPIDPLPITLVISGVLYLVGAYLGPPPRREALVKFWGTQEEIDRIVGVEAPQVGMVRRT